MMAVDRGRRDRVALALEDATAVGVEAGEVPGRRGGQAFQRREDLVVADAAVRHGAEPRHPPAQALRHAVIPAGVVRHVQADQLGQRQVAVAQRQRCQGGDGRRAGRRGGRFTGGFFDLGHLRFPISCHRHSSPAVLVRVA
jgi:hypothetical protein